MIKIMDNGKVFVDFENKKTKYRRIEAIDKQFHSTMLKIIQFGNFIYAITNKII